jgi:phenylpropionate dioxygenase-like ring-hydroxylating dioxygenase large terminal subunit
VPLTLPPRESAMTTQELNALVRTGEGLVHRKIFWDEEIYRLELERIFTRCWLYLGHESQLKAPGDYFTTYMGEDPVIVWRDKHGKVRAYLNTCQHRGMKVCRVDSGNATSLSCSFHGWTYNSEGELIGVPFHREVYAADLDRTRWGLREVGKVTIYGGLIFGCWRTAGLPSWDCARLGWRYRKAHSSSARPMHSLSIMVMACSKRCSIPRPTRPT